MPGILASFTRLSAALVDARDLPADLTQAYLARSQTALGEQLDALLLRFEAAVATGQDADSVIRDVLLKDASLGPAARLILIMWYTGGIQRGPDWDLTSPDHFYRALVWDVVGAHPPTLSNGYFGHWKYPPEQA